MGFKTRKETEPVSPSITDVPALDECLAKSRKVITSGKEPQCVPGCTVEQHCETVGEIAKALLSLLPDFLVSRLFPVGSVLTAAVHDCGKVSPQFFFKIQSALDNKEKILEKYPYLESICSNNDEESVGWHAGIGYNTLIGLKHKDCAEVVGQHHGYFTDPKKIPGKADPNRFGGPNWEHRREELIKKLAAFFNEKLPDSLTAEQICALSGLTCVADWIGSGSCFDGADDGPVTRKLVQKAIAAAGFRRLQIIPNLSFKEIFGFNPNPVQSALCSQCRKTGRGVYVLEAPMGIGKTEAALYVAYKLLEANEATGIYFALPTRLTSDRIYDRFTGFIRKILKDPENYFPMLLHADNFLQMHELRKKWLGGMGGEGEPGNSWFDSSKRGLLARFAVGTVDQALLAVMNVKHAFVREFGLAGKVVILDEVHSYDMYTGTLIKELVDRLTALGSTVIILSATLTCSKKQQLLGGGIGDEAKERAYPLISCKKTDDSRISVCPVSVAGAESTVSFGFHSQDDCLKEAVERAMAGQQVLWIENTVKDAQEIYRRISPFCTTSGIECGLLHSRFIQKDRFEKENRWTAVLGKDTRERSRQGRILVGTQILEQSLDIDADFMVSRFAPTDMLLQRSGRLWRHRFITRPESARQEMWLIEPEVEDVAKQPQKAFGSSSYLYWEYVLCRSFETMKNKFIDSNGIINMPEDIRSLLENTYRDRKEDQDSSTFLGMLYRDMVYGKGYGKSHRSGIEELRKKALANLSYRVIIKPNDGVLTRYSPDQEAETGIIIIKECFSRRNHIIYRFLDDTEIEISPNSRFTKKENIADLALHLKENTVMCKNRFLPEQRMKVKQACNLGLDCLYYNKDKCQNFPFLLMQAGDDYPSSLNVFNFGTQSMEYKIHYSRHLGLETKKS